MATKEKTLLLIDADMLCYESSAAVEQEVCWHEDFWTLHSDAKDAQCKFQERLDSIIQKLRVKNYEIIMCFSSSENFRKTIYPPYKSNRNKRKPVCYRALKQWVESKYNTKVISGLEADDQLGILATSNSNAIIVSGDKDMKTIPGLFYHYLKDELYENTPEQAQYNHYVQVLTGDVTDGYPGCPGIGPKTAQKILDSDCSWEAVVRTFESKGLSESEALVQARVAKILDKDYYDDELGVILWEPKSVPKKTKGER